VNTNPPVLRYATPVDDEIDYTQHTEPELVDMFGRLDPRYAPAECTRLAKRLTDLGYIVTDGTTGPGSATPLPEKMKSLIGTTTPFECKVDFGPTNSFFAFLGWSHNSLGGHRLRSPGDRRDLCMDYRPSRQRRVDLPY
jgi:hypothetical protein